MPSLSRKTSTWRSALGFSALAAMIALGSPGVRVAKAEGTAPVRVAKAEGTAPVPAADAEGPGSMSVARTPLPFTGGDGLPLEDAGSCQIGDDRRPLPGAGQVAEAMQQLARTAPEDAVVFSGTGHNYRTGNDALAEIRRIREEIRRDQAQATP